MLSGVLMEVSYIHDGIRKSRYARIDFYKLTETDALPPQTLARAHTHTHTQTQVYSSSFSSKPRKRQEDQH